MEGIISGGHDKYENEEGSPDCKKVVQDTNMNAKDDNSSSETCFNNPTSSPSSGSAGNHRKSGGTNAAAGETSVDLATNTNDSARPAKRLFGETIPATAGSSAPMPNMDDAATNSQEISESKSTAEAAMTRTESSNTADKGDAEVDEINAGASPDSDNSSSNNDTRQRKPEAIHQQHFRTERRSSKRQRSAPSSHRYSPGEGGGLASKKSKANNNNGGVGGSTTGIGNADVTGKAHPSLSSSTSSSSFGDGRVEAKKNPDNKARGRGNGGNNSSKQQNSSAPGKGWSEPAYRWIDEDARRNDNTTASSMEHEGVEIDFTNSKTSVWTPPPPFVVRLGDVVLMSSGGGAPWDATNGAKRQRNLQASQGKQPEVVPIYNDPASREAGLGALDPYIGYVERLWEEVDPDPSRKGQGQRKKKTKNANAAAAKPSSPRSTRMMIRTRWFFKKENIEGLKGNLIVEGGGGTEEAKHNGRLNSREEIMATMASRDLVLTDQSDDNAISTVLGKIKVVKRKPLDWSSSSSDNMKTSNDPRGGVRGGVFFCRYNLSFCSVKPLGGKDSIVVKFSPCSNEADGSDATFRSNAGGDGAHENAAKGMDSSEHTNNSTGGGGDGYASTGGGGNSNNNYVANTASLSTSFSPRRAALGASEGATAVGKIKIGPNHQAAIPAQLDLARKSSFRGLANPPSQRMPMMVWDPATDEDESNEFLEEARCLLLGHLKTVGLEPFHELNYIESPNAKAEAKKPREISIDRLLTELHECKGNVRRAIKKISNNPEKYMTIWAQNDRDQFDAGYRTYRESIRMIAISLGKSKTCKDTVDYQYRFKLVENFRRFQRKKREKAEEIMATVEDRMLNEKVKAEEKKSQAQAMVETTTDISSSEEEEVKAVHPPTNSGGGIDSKGLGCKLAAVPTTRGDGPVNNRVRTWFRTGGSSNGEVGATQQRRNLACEFLTQVRERVGGDAYAALARSLVACNSGMATDDSLVEVKDAAKEVMKGHPDLLERFVTFLPKEIRSV